MSSHTLEEKDALRFFDKGGSISSMRNIWNPWHGCVKCSEGCENCYMYYLDRMRGMDGSQIYRTKAAFDYPVQKNKYGNYRIPSGSAIHVCLTSDFFLREADGWRGEAWDMMRERRDVKFFLITKRPERVADCLPSDWENGWENIALSVTCENQRRADERLPILLSLPFRHKRVMCAPLLGQVSVEKYLRSGQIEQVMCGGENYDGARPCDFEWVKILRRECEACDVTFCFFETGTVFVKDGKRYHLPDKGVQSRMAHKSGMSYEGKPVVFRLTDAMGFSYTEPCPDDPAQPVDSVENDDYSPRCKTCGRRIVCEGCSGCGQCGKRERKRRI